MANFTDLLHIPAETIAHEMNKKTDFFVSPGMVTLLSTENNPSHMAVYAAQTGPATILCLAHSNGNFYVQTFVWK